ncbi:cytochrome P450 [Dactylonectria macrodidyma]|uniref:Cytochrome P450 n=1 Tax=Dactylonectria macrodidyma TaxID=307937 RepID=A0A9P9JAP1_9HYPO|nr:cytochrome P450 [Dactylonectria macrodidyma]
MERNVTAEPPGFLAFAVDNIKQSATGYLTVLGLIISMALFNKFLSPSIDGREPPPLRSSIPVIGHLIGMIRHQGGYFKILHDTARRQIATLPILNGKLYIIFDPAIIQAAYRNKRLCFMPFAVEFAQRELGFSDRALKILKETDLIPDFFAVIHPAMTGSHLHKMNANALNYVSKQLDGIGGGGDAFVVPNLFVWVRDLMTMATTEALYGPDNPFRGRPSLIQDVWDFERDLPMVLLNVFPSITARTAFYARGRVQAALGEYYEAEKDRHEDAAQIVKSRADVLRRYGIVGAEVGHFELALLHVGTANTIPTLFWFMAHIFTRPNLVQRLRDEALPVAHRSTNDEVTVDITTLDQQCPLLVNCYREAMRLSNKAVGNRRVLEDTTVSDGKGNSYLLKKGLNVQMSSEVLHNMKNVWGDNIQDFDPERFTDNGSKDSSQSERAKRLAFTPFGGGRHLCPGRNFAFAENLGLVTCLLLGFDVLPLDGDAADFKAPSMMRCSFAEAASKPENYGEGFGVQIKRREGWESTKWLFVS